MKFSCTQENFNTGLGVVAHVASRSANLPILSNVLLKTTKSGLELVATNLEVAVVTVVRGKVEGEGAITVNSRLLNDAVSLLPKERIDLEVQGTDLTLRCGKHHTTIRGLAADDFPVIPEVAASGGAGFATTNLEEALSGVVFAVNPEEGRPEIAGVYFEQSARGLVVAGTDSYRLAEYVVENTKGKLSLEKFILPLRAAQEVLRVASTSGEAEVQVLTNETQALWQFGETRVVSRLVAGQYPDYQQIIPKNFATKIQLSREELLRAVRSAALFARSGINDVRLGLNPDNKTLVVSSANSQLGENVVELPLTSAEGETNEVVFNYRYLLEGLQAIGESEVVLEVVGPKNPGVLKPKDSASYLYIIMPIRQ
jgi:DNA polymerase-3 subunit beta